MALVKHQKRATYDQLSDEAKDGVGSPCCSGSEKSVWIRSSDRPGHALEQVSPVGVFTAALSGEFGTPAQIQTIQWLDRELDLLREREAERSTSGKLTVEPQYVADQGGFVRISGTALIEPDEGGPEPASVDDMTEHELLEHGVQAYEEAIRRHFIDPVTFWDETLDRYVLIPMETQSPDERPIGIGTRLLYINPGSLDGRYPPKLSHATVIGPGKEPDTLHLFVVTSAPGFFFNDSVAFGPRPGCWIWPL